MDSILASHPAAPGSSLSVFKKFFQKKILDVVEIYRQRALLSQWTVQKSLKVDRTYPVLVREVLQKMATLNGTTILSRPSKHRPSKC